MAKKKQETYQYIHPQAPVTYFDPNQFKSFIDNRVQQYKASDPWFSDPQAIISLGHAYSAFKKSEQENDPILQDLAKALALKSINQNALQSTLQQVLPGSNLSLTTKNLNQLQDIAQKRAALAGSGVDPNAVTDDRNWLEKLLNTPKNTGFFGDIENLLNRGVNAVKGGLIEGAKHDAAEINIDPVAWQAWKGSTSDVFKSQEEIDAWKKKNKQRYDEFLKKVEEFQNKNGDTQDAILRAAKAGITGKQQYSLAQNIARLEHKKAPSAGDRAAEFAFDMTGDPFMPLYDIATTGVIKGAKAIGLDKAASAIAKSSPVQAVYQPLSNTVIQPVSRIIDKLLQTGGMKYNLAGQVDPTNFVARTMYKWRGLLANATDEALQNVSNALAYVGGDWEKGNLLSKIMESDILRTRLDPERLQLIQKLSDAGWYVPDHQDALKILMKAPVEDVSKYADELAGLKLQHDELMAAAGEASKAGKMQLVERLAFQASKIAKQQNKVAQKLEKALNIDSLISDFKAKNLSTLNKLQAVEELKNHPALDYAANMLMKSNAVIRKLAESIGLNLDQIKGYMAHVLTDNAHEILKDPGVRKTLEKKFGGSGKVLEREIKDMTVDEINKAVGRDLFSPNAFFATAKGQLRLLRFIVLEGLKKELFSNPEVAIKVEDALKYGLDPNALNIQKDGLFGLKGRPVQVNATEFTIKRNPELQDMFENASDIVSGNYYVTPGVYEALQKFSNLLNDDGALEEFGKVVDSLHRFFKKTTTFRTSYHINNLAGALINQYLKGMSTEDVARYNFKAAQILSRASKAMRKVGEPLTKEEENALKIVKEFKAQGLGNSGVHSVDMTLSGKIGNEKEIKNMLQEAQYSPMGKVAYKFSKGKIFDASRQFGENVDEVTRLGLYMYERAQGKSAVEAAKDVRQALFDYGDLTEFERKVFRRYIPFYTFTRKNIPYVINRLIHAPERIARIVKTVGAASDASGQDQRIVPDYIKEGLAIPIGGNRYIDINNPLMDLHRVMTPSEWAKDLTDMVSPYAKLPLELGTGKDFFTGKDIKNPWTYSLQQSSPLVTNLAQAIKAGTKGDVMGAVEKALGFSTIKNYDQAKFLQGYLSKEDALLSQAIKDRKASGKPMLTLDQLRSVGLLGSGQATDAQVKEMKGLIQKAQQKGLDPNLVTTLKQMAMKSTDKDIPKLTEVMKQLNIPDDMIKEITKDHLKTSDTVNKLKKTGIKGLDSGTIKKELQKKVKSVSDDKLPDLIQQMKQLGVSDTDIAQMLSQRPQTNSILDQLKKQMK